MYNDYFTFWIQRHGRKDFEELINKVCQNTTIPKKIQSIPKDDYLFHYFFIAYCIITLDYFGLTSHQISFILDLSLTLGICKAFPPERILEEQKNVIPDVLEFVKKDLEIYENTK